MTLIQMNRRVDTTTAAALPGWLLVLAILVSSAAHRAHGDEGRLDAGATRPEFTPDWAEPLPAPAPSVSTALPKAFGPVTPAARQPAGALSGRIVFMNGGHGWTWDPDYWRLQRGTGNEMNEDYGNLDQMNFFAAYCFNAGAVVVPMRPLGQQTNEVVLDNDDPAVTWAGTWFDSVSTYFFGSAGDVPYRYAALSATETAQATYTPTIPVAGFYPVYTWVRAGSDRGDQLYRIRHTGGETQLRIPHHMVGNGWVYLGEYHFNSGSNSLLGAVVVSNLRGSAAGTYTFADAIRFGNGMGSVDRGTGVSSYPREEENCRYWIQANLGQGQSSTLYDSAGADENDSWSAPPKYSAEMNREDEGSIYKRIHISFHSNAGGGRGTLALITSDPTPNQSALAQLCGRAVNDELVALGAPPLEVAWNNRATVTYSGGYSEIDGSLFNYEMDATIIEVAFHDNASDALLMRDPKARAAVGRAAMHAVIKYMNQFDGVPLLFPPEPPVNVRAQGVSDGSIILNWDAPVSVAGSGAQTGYVIYRATNGYGFGNPVMVSNVTTWRITGLTTNADHYFRIAAVNSAGESMPSEVVGCRAPTATPAPRVLVVNAFDRYDRTANLRQNTTRQAWAPPDATGTIERVLPRRVNSFDYVVQHGRAVSAAGFPFDSCQNEAVVSGAVALGDYRVVIWACGQESTGDETFSDAEQTALAAFHDAGGHLFVSGSEIAWDLDRASGPTSADRAFFNNHLKADLAGDANDNSGSYALASTPGGIFAARSTTTFDDGSGSTYWVKTPDVLTPSGTGVVAALNYSGNTNGAAAIQYDGSAGGGRVVYFGFPFETIASANRRSQYMADALAFFTADTITLSGVGAAWKFHDSGADLGTAWRGTGYNDSAWPSGPAQLGFGEGDEATLVHTNRLRITTYFRRAFTVADANELETLTLRLKRDDGAVVFLNGTEIFRSNMPTGTVVAATWAGGAVGGADESAWFTNSVDAALLRTGTNVLAVELHQAGTNSSDLSFDLELTASPRAPVPVVFSPAGAVWKFRDDAANLGAAWRSNTYNDAAWKYGLAMLGFGDASGVLPATVVVSNGQVTTYFRRQFHVPATNLVRSLAARMQRDDGAVVFLNGAEIWRDNMTNSGVISFTNLALTAISGTAETNWITATLSPAALVNGFNLLAVEIHQSSATSSDIAFDFELLGSAVIGAEPPLAIDSGAGATVCSWPADGSYFTLEVATNLTAPVLWQRATNAPVLQGNRWMVTLPSTNGPQRFFRLALP
jgi:hypothetical protein